MQENVVVCAVVWRSSTGHWMMTSDYNTASNYHHNHNYNHNLDRISINMIDSLTETLEEWRSTLHDSSNNERHLICLELVRVHPDGKLSICTTHLRLFQTKVRKRLKWVKFIKKNALRYILNREMTGRGLRMCPKLTPSDLRN